MWYWSSSAVAESDYAWIVQFYDGLIFYEAAYGSGYARCVRQSADREKW
jgi:hypothetical protein